MEKENPDFIGNRKDVLSKEQDYEVFDLDCKTSTMIHEYKNQLYYTATGCARCHQTCVTFGC